MPRLCHPIAASALTSLVISISPAQAQTSASYTGEARLAREFTQASDSGPYARAQALAPSVFALPRSDWAAQLQLKGDVKHRLDPERSVSLHADAQAVAQRPDGTTDTTTTSRFNELYASAELGAWQASAGRRIVSWDVAYAFRPNDVVQREVRRQLLSSTPQGRGVVQLEHFGNDAATSLVWVEPTRGADESALALRHYRRFGALDLHAHAHWSRATRTSLGAALAWVATDELEVHASTRWLPRHDTRTLTDAATATPGQPQRTAPWQDTPAGSTHQSLIGASWTGGPDVTVLAEWWHDGTARPDAVWAQWSTRTAALAEPGNLAWQAAELSTGPTSLRQNNIYLRASLKRDAWEWSLDTLVTPADGGRLTGAGLRWQGDQWRVEAAWRVAGGPAASLYRQLPVRQTGALALTRSF